MKGLTWHDTATDTNPNENENEPTAAAVTGRGGTTGGA